MGQVHSQSQSQSKGCHCCCCFRSCCAWAPPEYPTLTLQMQNPSTDPNSVCSLVTLSVSNYTLPLVSIPTSRTLITSTSTSTVHVNRVQCAAGIIREITPAGTSTTWGRSGCIFKATALPLHSRLHLYRLCNVVWCVFYVRIMGT